MNELLLLLLPVAAFSGWWIAKRNMSATAKVHTDLSSHYFEGLNYLLNEQPDKAIEVFIKMLEVDSETVETHLALGNLFRRRGEVDRAIRIHQNLIARPTLDGQQRTHALYELSEDYMYAGLLDRAEALFSELVDIGDYKQQALQRLIEIYQQEKDWDKAIETMRKLEGTSGERKSGVIAHYYCELAEHARQNKDMDLARKMIKKAFSSDRKCVRASILLGDIETGLGNYKQAIRAYKQVEDQNPEYISEVIKSLCVCYEHTGNLKELADYLRKILENHGGITPMLALAQLIKEQDGENEAIAFIIEQLRQRPSVRGLDQLIELNLVRAEGTARENLLILNDLMKKVMEGRPVYKCNTCGFTGKVMHWYCPSCKNWNTVKPVQGVVGE